MAMVGGISKGGFMEKKELLKNKVLYALGKMLKYTVLVAIIGIIIGIAIKLIFDVNLSTTYKILGGIIIFGAVASQFGAGNMHRDYNYNMAKMSSNNKFDSFSTNMDESILFAIIGGVGGILVFLAGILVERFL